MIRYFTEDTTFTLKGKRLTISVLGYKSRTIDISDDSEKLFVSLRQDAKALKEVTVKKKVTETVYNVLADRYDSMDTDRVAAEIINDVRQLRRLLPGDG